MRIYINQLKFCGAKSLFVEHSTDKTLDTDMIKFSFPVVEKSNVRLTTRVGRLFPDLQGKFICNKAENGEIDFEAGERLS